MIAAVIIAGSAAHHVQAPSPQFTATSTPEPVAYSYAVELHDLTGVQDWPEQPTPTPEPTLAPARTPNVQAAAVSTPLPVSGDVPWFVPPEWHQRYLECLTHPERHNVSEWVWRYSAQSGRDPGWDYNDAMSIVGAEGGDDLCQFNSKGSGACGPFQTLYCAGLTPEEHYAAAFAKWLDGGGSFDRHWRNHWR